MRQMWTRFAGGRKHAWIYGIVLLSTFSAPTSFGQVEEYDLKAAFIFNFTRFISWPDQRIEEKSLSNFTIGLLGDDPFNGSLNQIVQGESVNDRKLSVRQLNDTNEAKDCDIVFIPSSRSGKLDETLRGTAGKSILTIGDSAEMAEQGCVIAFERSGKNIKLIVNLPAAEKAQLKISSKLLRLSRLIQ